VGRNVSNQGTVNGTISAVAFTNVTNDPDTGAANDATLTPINLINMFARDGKAPEPTTGQAPLLFTVALSQPRAAA
jgi:hypothetical protein